jgi:hypothetical protein
MPRPRKYESEEQAYEAKKNQSRARYWVKKGTTERERVPIINYIITAEDVGLTIKQLKDKLKLATAVQSTSQSAAIPDSPAIQNPEIIYKCCEDQICEDHPLDFEDEDGDFKRRLETDEEFRKEIEANEEEFRKDYIEKESKILH